MSRERQKKQSEEVRGQILDAARRIIEAEGPEALSVRSITKEIGYSSGIVYHYFKDKDEILSHILLESYGKILQAVGSLSQGLEPEEALRAAITDYIKNALAHSSEYKAIMLSSSPTVLSASAVLGEDDADKRRAMSALTSTLEEGVSSGLFSPCDVKLTACGIWCAMFGLTMRLIIEGSNVPPERAERLIENTVDFILKGLKA